LRGISWRWCSRGFQLGRQAFDEPRDDVVLAAALLPPRRHLRPELGYQVVSALDTTT